MSDWLIYYFVGCFAVVLLQIGSFTFFATLDWFLKGSVFRKNLKKLDPPEEKKSFWSKALIVFGMLLFDVALSWIGVLLQLWNIGTRLLGMVRDIFASVPEELKVLRYPLRNNPEMSREAVWAYLRAAEAKFGGVQASEHTLLYSIQAVREHYPYFDRVAALNQLKTLNAVSPDAIAAALEQVRTPKSNY